MPNKEEEHSWSAIDEAIEPGTTPIDRVVKEAAAWQYHQFHIHATENPLSLTAMLKKTLETFIRLTPQEMKALREAHKEFTPHHY